MQYLPLLEASDVYKPKVKQVLYKWIFGEDYKDENDVKIKTLNNIKNYLFKYAGKKLSDDDIKTLSEKLSKIGIDINDILDGNVISKDKLIKTFDDKIKELKGGDKDNIIETLYEQLYIIWNELTQGKAKNPINMIYFVGWIIKQFNKNEYAIKRILNAFKVKPEYINDEVNNRLTELIVAYIRPKLNDYINNIDLINKYLLKKLKLKYPTKNINNVSIKDIYDFNGVTKTIESYNGPFSAEIFNDKCTRIVEINTQSNDDVTEYINSFGTENLVYEDKYCRIYEEHGIDDTIKYGKGYSFCTAKTKGFNYYYQYRFNLDPDELYTSYELASYYVYFKNEDVIDSDNTNVGNSPDEGIFSRGKMIIVDAGYDDEIYKKYPNDRNKWKKTYFVTTSENVTQEYDTLYKLVSKYPILKEPASKGVFKPRPYNDYEMAAYKIDNVASSMIGNLKYLNLNLNSKFKLNDKEITLEELLSNPETSKMFANMIVSSISKHSYSGDIIKNIWNDVVDIFNKRLDFREHKIELIEDKFKNAFDILRFIWNNIDNKKLSGDSCIGKFVNEALEDYETVCNRLNRYYFWYKQFIEDTLTYCNRKQVFPDYNQISKDYDEYIDMKIRQTIAPLNHFIGLLNKDYSFNNNSDNISIDAINNIKKNIIGKNNNIKDIRDKIKDIFKNGKNILNIENSIMNDGFDKKINDNPEFVRNIGGEGNIDAITHYIDSPLVSKRELYTDFNIITNKKEITPEIKQSFIDASNKGKINSLIFTNTNIDDININNIIDGLNINKTKFNDDDKNNPPLKMLTDLKFNKLNKTDTILFNGRSARTSIGNEIYISESNIRKAEFKNIDADNTKFDFIVDKSYIHELYILSSECGALLIKGGSHVGNLIIDDLTLYSIKISSDDSRVDNIIFDNESFIQLIENGTSVNEYNNIILKNNSHINDYDFRGNSDKETTFKRLIDRIKLLNTSISQGQYYSSKYHKFMKFSDDKIEEMEEKIEKVKQKLLDYLHIKLNDTSSITIKDVDFYL